MGECDKETTFKILNFFYESGESFLDTANNYQDGESEQRIGKWMQEREIRHQMVVATKQVFRCGSVVVICRLEIGLGTASQWRISHLTSEAMGQNHCGILSTPVFSSGGQHIYT